MSFFFSRSTRRMLGFSTTCTNTTPRTSISSFPLLSTTQNRSMILTTMFRETKVNQTYPQMSNTNTNNIIINIHNNNNTMYEKRCMVHVMITKSKSENTEMIQQTTISKDDDLSTILKSSTTNIQQEQEQDLQQEPEQEQYQLSITESCWKRIHHLALKKNHSLSDMYLRVYVDAGGCSGFSYKFELDTTEIDSTDDIVFTNIGLTNNDNNSNNTNNKNQEIARVVVDQSTYNMIQGSTIDYVEEMIKSTFEVKNNPQSESACGCGSSFAIKNFNKNPALD